MLGHLTGFFAMGPPPLNSQIDWATILEKWQKTHKRRSLSPVKKQKITPIHFLLAKLNLKGRKKKVVPKLTLLSLARTQYYSASLCGGLDCVSIVRRLTRQETNDRDGIESCACLRVFAPLPIGRSALVVRKDGLVRTPAKIFTICVCLLFIFTAHSLLVFVFVFCFSVLNRRTVYVGQEGRPQVGTE